MNKATIWQLNVSLVIEYCSKGSLADVLANPDIDLAWIFRFALINDLISGKCVCTCACPHSLLTPIYTHRDAIFASIEISIPRVPNVRLLHGDWKMGAQDFQLWAQAPAIHTSGRYHGVLSYCPKKKA